ncbi:MAG: polyprenyl diphosphate synthase [Clostridia bacterium]
MDAQLKIPTHIAFIMDGNGRWARAKGLPRKVGHKYGVDALKVVVDECDKLGIKVVTFYAFSTENWSRPQDEIDALFEMIKKFAEKELDDYVKKGYRVHILGDLTQIPTVTRECLEKIMTRSKDNGGLVVNIAINYGGRQEIVAAVNKIVQNGVMHVDMQMIEDCLYTAGQPSPDVIVRSSGEKRLSNFLLWQCAYSELIFVDEHWPDFDKKMMKRIVEEYSKRDRRFGKI